MGCAASNDRAERRRRDRAPGHAEAPTKGNSVARQHNAPQDPVSVAPAAGRRRGCKVAPEPKEQGEPPAQAPAMPCSPSFRFYCQKAAAVDALVAAADADGGDSDGPVRVTGMPQAIKKNDPAHNSGEPSKSKEASGWLKFRGLSIVAAAVYSLLRRRSTAVCRLFRRRSTAAPPAAKSHHPSAASSPAPAADPIPYL